MRRKYFLFSAMALAIAAGIQVLKNPEPGQPIPGETHPEIQIPQHSGPTESPATASAGQARSIRLSAKTSEPPRKVRTLLEIIESHNDNDPRLDREFNELTSEEKTAFREQYLRTPRENRNSRGTIVFVLGLNVREETDLNFFGSVIAEPPCSTMEDCNRTEEQPTNQDPHLLTPAWVLNYPQFVAITAMQGVMTGTQASPQLKAAAQKVLKLAQDSPIPAVAEFASRSDL